MFQNIYIYLHQHKLPYSHDSSQTWKNNLHEILIIILFNKLERWKVLSISITTVIISALMNWLGEKNCAVLAAMKIFTAALEFLHEDRIEVSV